MEVWTTAKYLTTTGEVLVFDNYEVSNYGRVRNKKKDRILNVGYEKGGYCIVRPCINGKVKKCLLHRLVLSSFTDNVDGSLQVNHKDEDKNNNTLPNLEWLTCTENNNYGTHNERSCKSRTGVFNIKSSKPVLQYDKNGTFIREWPSVNEVQRQLGISTGNISNCCNGKRKIAGGFVWQYKE